MYMLYFLLTTLLEKNHVSKWALLLWQVGLITNVQFYFLNMPVNVNP